MLFFEHKNVKITINCQIWLLWWKCTIHINCNDTNEKSFRINCCRRRQKDSELIWGNMFFPRHIPSPTGIRSEVFFFQLLYVQFNIFFFIYLRNLILVIKLNQKLISPKIQLRAVLPHWTEINNVLMKRTNEL